MAQDTQTIQDSEKGVCIAKRNTASELQADQVDQVDTTCCAEYSCNDGFEAFKEMPGEELLYDLADLFKVFADTTRIKILYALMDKPLCVNDIALAVEASQTAVSHQLRALKQARLVKFQRDGKNVIYSLSDDHVYTMLAQGLTHICE